MDAQVINFIEIKSKRFLVQCYQLLELLGPNDRSSKSTTPKQNVNSIFQKYFSNSLNQNVASSTEKAKSTPTTTSDSMR